MVYFEGHVIIDLKVFIEVEPCSIQGPFCATESAIFEDPALTLVTEIDMGLEL